MALHQSLTFHPSGLLQVGRSVVLHRLMDREALMLLFDGSESFLFVARMTYGFVK